MKPYLLFLILLLFSVFSCTIKQHEPLPTHGMLWEITGNKLKTPSYLFGTYHLQGGTQILDSIKFFDSIFDSSDQFLCEFNYRKPNIQKPIEKITSKKTDNRLKPWPTADSTYENLISIREKKLLDSTLYSDKFLTYIKKLNLRPLRLLSYIKLSYSKSNKNTLQKTAEESKPEKDSTKSIMLDLYLQNLAEKRNMNIVGLESVEEIQKNKKSIFSQVPQLSYRTEVDILMFYIENHATLDSLNKEFAKNALSAYLKQDISLCLSLSTQQTKVSNMKNNPIHLYLGNEKFYEKRDILIINERNNNWMKKIPDLITEKSSFIAVGAAHLAGENGLINQLRELGYIVVPVQDNKK